MEVDISPERSKKIFSIKILQFEQLKVDSIEQPKARSGHRLTCDQSGNLYSFGGYNNNLSLEDELDLKDDEDWQKSRPLFSELWKYNISSARFHKIKTTGEFPKTLASHCLDLLNDELLISFGGTAVPFEHHSSNSMYLCNLKNNIWTLMDPLCNSDSQFPTKKYGQALCSDFANEKIYVSGGTDGYFFTIDVHCFDFKKKLWSKLSNLDCLVEPRYRHEMTLFDNKLFIFGGGGAQDEYDLQMLPVFDLKSNSWSKIKTIPHFTNNGRGKFPAPRKCHSISVYNNFVYLVGGLSKKRICKDLWKFNLETKKWDLLIENLPFAVFFHGATISPQSQLSIFGGISLDAKKRQKRSNKLFSVWVDIPPLGEMSWRALLYYNNNFKNKTDNELIKLGIPYNFIKRLRD